MTVQTSFDSVKEDLSHFSYLTGQMGRLQTVSFVPVVAGDVVDLSAVGVMRLSPLRRGLAMDSKVDICTFYVPHRHAYGEEWIQFMKDGIHAKPLSDLPCHDKPFALNFLSTNSNFRNRCPKWLHKAYLSIYNNFFKYPSDADVTANPDSLPFHGDVSRFGLPCCHLPSIWSAPVPAEFKPTYDVDVTGSSIDIIQLNNAYASLDTEQERTLFMTRYRDVIKSFGGKTYYDADSRPHMLMRSEFYASGYDVDGTSQESLGQFSGRVQQNFSHRVPDFYVPEHGVIMTVALVRFHPVNQYETDYLVTQSSPDYHTFANDPVLMGNSPVVNFTPADIFDGTTDVSSKFYVAAGQWYRYKSNFVSETYRYVEGFPFLGKIPTVSGNKQAYVDPSDYNNMFQTIQLGHWNAQCKVNVSIRRVAPTTRDSIMTS